MEPEEITKLREEIDETYDQFGGRVGVSGNTIRRWERGQVKPGPYWQVKLRKIRYQFNRQKAKAG